MDPISIVVWTLFFVTLGLVVYFIIQVFFDFGIEDLFQPYVDSEKKNSEEEFEEENAKTFSKSQKILILLIEDDRDMRKLLADHLERAGFDVLKASDGIKGKALAYKYSPDLILLDLMLPNVDGLTLCQRLRRDERTSNIPILMITALGGLKDKVTGFNSGADDYITKPFDLEELSVRIKSLLGINDIDQSNLTCEQEILSYGPLTLVPERFEAIWFETLIRLSYLEFELLHYLLQRHGQIVSLEQIVKEFWGYDIDGIRKVRIIVRNLRRKLEPDSRKPRFLKTIYGKGYCLLLD